MHYVEFRSFIHDLRQPLHALRFNNLNLDCERHATEDGTQNTETALSYPEDQISHHPHTALGRKGAAVDCEAQPNAPGLKEVLDAMAKMFAPDAEAKALLLRFGWSEHHAAVTPPAADADRIEPDG